MEHDVVGDVAQLFGESLQCGPDSLSDRYQPARRRPVEMGTVFSGNYEDFVRSSAPERAERDCVLG